MRVYTLYFHTKEQVLQLPESREWIDVTDFQKYIEGEKDHMAYFTKAQVEKSRKNINWIETYQIKNLEGVRSNCVLVLPAPY